LHVKAGVPDSSKAFKASMVIRRIFPRPDLFETPPRMALAPAERINLVDQLRILLMEAMAAPKAAAQDQAEAGAERSRLVRVYPSIIVRQCPT
jgi:hypothetical protein